MISNTVLFGPSAIRADIRSFHVYFSSKILSVIRADCNVIFSKFVSPDEESSAIGRRTDVNFEHC